MKRQFTTLLGITVFLIGSVFGVIQEETLSSPYMTKDGKEIVVILSGDSNHRLITVTVENGEPLNYEQRQWGKGRQLYVDADDFPTLAKTGLHSDVELEQIKTITGRSIVEITELGRPGSLSGAGFMAEDEDIISILGGDNRLVSKLGLTHSQMAKPLYHEWNMILEDNKLKRLGRFWEHCILYNENKIFIKVEGSRGWQESLFNDEIKGMYQMEMWRELELEEKAFLLEKYPDLGEVRMTELQKKLSHIHTGEMVPYYIMRYGFYEGHTDYRADPIAISFVFGFKSLQEIEAAFPGKLYEALTEHHTRENVDTAKLYEELAGRYQFDRGGTPIVLLVYVNEGVLLVDEPRFPHARMEPVDLDKLEFRANHENGLYKFRFVRDKEGKIAESFWIVGEKEYAGFKLGVGPLPSRFTLEQLQEDFQQIRRAMEGMHPAMYDYISKEDFDVLFDQRFKELKSSMRLEDAFRVFASLMARMGCMHSNVWMPSGYWNNLSGKLFPIKMRFVGKDAYAYRSYSETDSLPAGAKILSINGKTMKKILRDLKTVISADARSDQYKKFRLGFRFPLIYSLFYGHPDSFDVVFQKPGEKTARKAVIHPVPTNRIWKNMIEPRDLDFDIWNDKSTAIMTIPHFDYYRDHDKFFGFVDGSFAEIEKKGIKNLIIDLRRNNGGDPFCAVRLFAHIAHEPVPYFSKPYGRYARLAEPVPLRENHYKGKLYVLIDGGGASTTGHLVGLLKYHKIGTLIGEETGATYICHDAKNSFLLRHTRFQVSVATGTFASAVQGLPQNRGILPDIRIPMAPQDMAAGKDTILEHTLSLIR